MRIFFIFYLLGLSVLGLDAQQRCGSGEYMDIVLKNDAFVKNRIEEIETFTQQKTTGNSASFRTNTISQVIKIPVVFHVLYNNVEENILPERIEAQLAALNRDFRKKNSDTANTPLAFLPLAADMEIEFYLAKSGPLGRSTTGIEKKYTPVKYWYSDDKMKFNTSYGADAWDPKSYLNIWICKLDDVLGYSAMPGSALQKDGIVISYQEIKNTATGNNKGRTLVHEVGHWLNLKHLWGDSFCGDDEVYDTPKQSTYTPGCPTGIRRTCGNTETGDMYMNFMDFTDDICMNLFSKGQKQRARSLFMPGGYRHSILSSAAFNTPAIFAAQLPDYYPKWAELRIFPNPATDNLNVFTEYDARWIGKDIQVIDMTGRIVLKTVINSSVQSVNISRLSPGVYFIRTENGNELMLKKFVKL